MNRIMRAVPVCLFVCAVALTGCFGPGARQHVFQLNETPAMLSEALAIEKAREALSKQGFDLERWQLRNLRKDPRDILIRPSKAPDGTPDIFLERNMRAPNWANWGRLHFTDGKRNRCVQVSLQGNRLVCTVVQLP